MEDVWKTITAPVFWVCSVAFAIVGGIVVNYAQRGLDRVFGGWSKRRKAKREADDIEFQADVHLLLSMAHLLPLFIARESRDRFRACTFVLVAGVMMGGVYGVARDNGPVLSGKAVVQVMGGILFSAMTLWRGALLFLRSQRHGAVAQRVLSIERNMWVAKTKTQPGPVHLDPVGAAVAEALGAPAKPR